MNINPEILQVAGGFVGIGGLIGVGVIVDRLRTPTGNHRAPKTTTPAAAPVLVAFDLDNAEVSDFAWCPECTTRRYSVIRPDGTARCWTCSTVTPAGAL